MQQRPTCVLLWVIGTPSFRSHQTRSPFHSLAVLCGNCPVSPKEEFCLPGHDAFISGLRCGWPLAHHALMAHRRGRCLCVSPNPEASPKPRVTDRVAALHCSEPLPTRASAPSPASLCPGPSRGGGSAGSHCSHPAPHTPMKSPRCQPL